MGKYRIKKIFRDGEKWYNIGEEVEFGAEKASEFIKMITPVIEPPSGVKKPTQETATDKRAKETR